MISQTGSGVEVIEKIAKQDLQFETTSRLARLIAASEPGARLPTERELCERLGVGRSTLREAVRSLAFIGAVRPRQGSGTYISTSDDQTLEKLIGLGLTLQRATVREIIEVRHTLELEAVRLAAERHTKDDRRDLESIMASMALVTTEARKASHYDLMYHVMLARASHNSVLVHFINGMRGLLEIWINKAVNRQAVIEEIVDEHNRVLEAVFHRLRERAAALMHEHLTKASERLFAVIGRDQSAGDYISLLLARSE